MYEAMASSGDGDGNEMKDYSEYLRSGIIKKFAFLFQCSILQFKGQGKLRFSSYFHINGWLVILG